MELANNTWNKGLLMDTHPMMLGNDSMTDCLNGTLVTMNGNEVILQNDMGNRRIDHAFLPSGYEPVGIKEHGGVIYVASYNPITNKSLIGSFPSPERIFDNNKELEASFDFDTFYDQTSTTDPKYITKAFYLVPLTTDSINVGDKFSIYSENLYNEENPISLSNFNNVDEDKIKSPKNGRYTIQVGVLNLLNNFLDITPLLKRWKYNKESKKSEVLNLDSTNFSSNYIFNSGYFISKNYIPLNYSETSSDAALIATRSKEAANTYAYKTAGPLYLKIIYNMPVAFNYTFSGNTIDKILSLNIKGIIKYNCPDGIAESSSSGDNEYINYMDGDLPKDTDIDFDLFNSCFNHIDFLSYELFSTQYSKEDFLKIEENVIINDAWKSIRLNYYDNFIAKYEDTWFENFIASEWSAYELNGDKASIIRNELDRLLISNYEESNSDAELVINGSETLVTKIKEYNKTIFDSYKIDTYIDDINIGSSNKFQTLLLKILLLFYFVPDSNKQAIGQKYGGDIRVIEDNIEYVGHMDTKFWSWFRMSYDKLEGSSDRKIWNSFTQGKGHYNKLETIFPNFDYVYAIEEITKNNITQKSSLYKWKDKIKTMLLSDYKDASIYNPSIYNLLLLYSKYIYESDFDAFATNYKNDYTNNIDSWVDKYWTNENILDIVYDAFSKDDDPADYNDPPFNKVIANLSSTNPTLYPSNKEKDFFATNNWEEYYTAWDLTPPDKNKKLAALIIYICKDLGEIPPKLTLNIQSYKNLIKQSEIKDLLMSSELIWEFYEQQNDNPQWADILAVKAFEWFTSDFFDYIKTDIVVVSEKFRSILWEEFENKLDNSLEWLALKKEAEEDTEKKYPENKPYIDWLQSEYQKYRNTTKETLEFNLSSNLQNTLYHKDDNYYYASINKTYKFKLPEIGANNRLSGTLAVRGGKHENHNYYVKELTSNFSFNIASLNSGSINLISYKFYNFYSDQQTKLLLLFEVYPRENEEFKNLRIKFEDYENKANLCYLSVSDFILNGTIVVPFSWKDTYIKEKSYTWIKFSYAADYDLITPANMIDFPYYSEKLCTYIGIAYNKLTSTESMDAKAYTWAPLSSAIESGIAEEDNTYTWIKFYNGNSVTDSPIEASLIGIATKLSFSTKNNDYDFYYWKDLGSTEGVDTSSTKEVDLEANTLYRVSFEYDSYYNKTLEHRILPTKDYWFLTTELFNDLYSTSILNYCTTTDKLFTDKLTITSNIEDIPTKSQDIKCNLTNPYPSRLQIYSLLFKIDITTNLTLLEVSSFFNSDLYPSGLELPTSITLRNDSFKDIHKVNIKGTPQYATISYPTKKIYTANLLNWNFVYVHVIGIDDTGPRDIFRMSWDTSINYRSNADHKMGNEISGNNHPFFIAQGNDPTNNTDFQTNIHTIASNLYSDSDIHPVIFYLYTGDSQNDLLQRNNNLSFAVVKKADDVWYLVHRLALPSSFEYVFADQDSSSLYKVAVDSNAIPLTVSASHDVLYEWVINKASSTYGFGNLIFNTSFKNGRVSCKFTTDVTNIIKDNLEKYGTFKFINIDTGSPTNINSAEQVVYEGGVDAGWKMLNYGICFLEWPSNKIKNNLQVFFYDFGGANSELKMNYYGV